MDDRRRGSTVVVSVASGRVGSRRDCRPVVRSEWRFSGQRELPETTCLCFSLQVSFGNRMSS